MDVFRELINYNLIDYFHRHQNVHKSEKDHVILQEVISIYAKSILRVTKRTWLLSVNIFVVRIPDAFLRSSSLN